MSAEGSLDLRLPIGGLFTVLGAMLAGFGMVTRGNAEIYVKSAGMNINLIWGAVMFVTGLIFFGLAKRGAAK